jgi:hypothetical protein
MTAQVDFAFDGDTYEPRLDHGRLAKQLNSVRALMLDDAWRTLGEIAALLNAPEASVSARLRDLRKVRNGAYSVLRRRRGNVYRGLFEYRVIPREHT